MCEPSDEDVEAVMLLSRLQRLEMALAAFVDALVDIIVELTEGEDN